MGKITQGILGPFSGKCGGIVGGSWKGIATIKGYQPQVSNPKTASQIENRSKLAFVVAFAQAILATVIKPLWDRFQSGMSGYNAFVSVNKSLFTTASPSDFSLLVTSRGKMAATEMESATADESESSIIISWADDTGEGFKLATDKAYVVVANPATGFVKGFATGVVRSDTQVTLSLPISTMGANAYHCYLSFLRADGSVVSNNSYLQATVQP